MSQSSKLVFVTGASGFLASHVINELIQQGYRVRASARKNKVEPLRALYKPVPTVEIVEISDIANGQFEEVLKGVDAVIHTASPLPGREDIDGMLKGAVDGSLNVLRLAEKVGVKKFVVTSSIAAVAMDPTIVGVTYRAHHWNPLTKNHATPDNPFLNYSISKKYAELAVWEWSEANPQVDVTTINPPFIYGPLAPLHLPISPGGFNALSTDLMVYALLSPTGGYPPRAGYADVRDIARAHVGALRTPSTVQGRKRILFASPHGLKFSEVLEAIKKARPEVESRLIKAPIPKYPFGGKYDLDFAPIEEVTGLKVEDFHTPIETFVDTVNSLLELEKSWKESGFVVEKIPTMM